MKMKSLKQFSNASLYNIVSQMSIVSYLFIILIMQLIVNTEFLLASNLG